MDLIKVDELEKLKHEERIKKANLLDFYFWWKDAKVKINYAILTHDWKPNEKVVVVVGMANIKQADNENEFINECLKMVSEGSGWAIESQYYNPMYGVIRLSISKIEDGLGD